MDLSIKPAILIGGPLMSHTFSTYGDVRNPVDEGVDFYQPDYGVIGVEFVLASCDRVPIVVNRSRPPYVFPIYS